MSSEDKGELLAQLEQQVYEGQDKTAGGKITIAEVLRKIKEQCLWPEWMTWAAYLLDRFDISEERAKQLFNFLDVREAIQGDRLPDRERQARALRKTDKGNWQAIWEKACQRSGKKPPTSRIIEDIIKEMKVDRADSESNETPPTKAEAPDQNPETAVAPTSEVEDAGDRRANESSNDDENRQPDPEPYVLDLELKLCGIPDPERVARHFEDEWKAIRDVLGADLGLRFDCPASKVTKLADALSQLLEGDIAQIDLKIKKTAAYQQPDFGRVSQTR